MIHWCSIAVVFSSGNFLQVISAERTLFSRRFSGKTYILEQFNDSVELEITIPQFYGPSKKLNFSTCEQMRARIHQSQKDTQFLQIVNLTLNASKSYNIGCHYIADSYFGRYKLYIYQIEEDLILKKWTVTSDGRKTDPVVIAKTELPITSVKVNRTLITVKTQGKDKNSSSIFEFYQELPWYEVGRNGTSCAEDYVCRKKRTREGMTLEQYFEIMVVVPAIFLIIVLTIGIGYCFRDPELGPEEEMLAHLNESSPNRLLIEQRIP
ncbi:hypothetical protein FO519_008539 [Halicephalobus sp. NKZ332]|nr:hypothetical protein FO519_008539 [Halicephalobus sp. NKZ332]